MKKQISIVSNENSGKFSFLLFATAFFLSALPVVVSAQDSPNSEPIVTVKAATPINGSPVFEVSVEKETKSFFDLNISDEEGIILYTERIKVPSYSKRFKIEIPDLKNIKLVVTLENEKHTFFLNRKLSFVQEESLSKL